MVLRGLINAVKAGYRGNAGSLSQISSPRLAGVGSRFGRWVRQLKGVVSGPGDLLAIGALGPAGGGLAFGATGIGLTVLLYYLWSNGMIPMLG